MAKKRTNNKDNVSKGVHCENITHFGEPITHFSEVRSAEVRLMSLVFGIQKVETVGVNSTSSEFCHEGIRGVSKRGGRKTGSSILRQ